MKKKLTTLIAMPLVALTLAGTEAVAAERSYYDRDGKMVYSKAAQNFRSALEKDHIRWAGQLNKEGTRPHNEIRNAQHSGICIDAPLEEFVKYEESIKSSEGSIMIQEMIRKRTLDTFHPGRHQEVGTQIEKEIEEIQHRNKPKESLLFGR